MTTSRIRTLQKPRRLTALQTHRSADNRLKQYAGMGMTLASPQLVFGLSPWLQLPSDAPLLIIHPPLLQPRNAAGLARPLARLRVCGNCLVRQAIGSV